MSWNSLITTTTVIIGLCGYIVVLQRSQASSIDPEHFLGTLFSHIYKSMIDDIIDSTCRKNHTSLEVQPDVLTRTR